MTPTEVAYLALVIGALSVFAVVLAFISWYARPRRGVPARRMRARAPKPSVAATHATAH